jgi:hypothetical protein
VDAAAGLAVETAAGKPITVWADAIFTDANANKTAEAEMNELNCMITSIKGFFIELLRGL